MRASGLFRIPVTMIIAVLVMMVGSASALAVMAIGPGVPSAGAATPGAGLTISALAQPSNFSPSRNAECKIARETEPLLIGQWSEHCDRYTVTVRNEGSEPTNGSTVTIKDVLPKNLTAVHVTTAQEEEFYPPALECELAAVSCTYGKALPAGATLVMVVDVEVSPSASGTVANSAMVTGGGAPTVATSGETTVSSTRAPFDVSTFAFTAFGVDGALDAQAGDHPNTLTTRFRFNTYKFPEGDTTSTSINYPPVQDVKDIVVDLPLGFVGNPQATPQCPQDLLQKNACPSKTRVGTIGIEGASVGSADVETQPVFNVAPEAGYPAEFGFEFLSVKFLMFASVVRTAAGYTLRVTVPGLPRLYSILRITGATLTFFGDPAVSNGSGSPPAAFFTNPMDCSAGPLNARITVDSWQNPGVYVSKEAISYPQVTGCNMLQFQPTIAVQPETAVADEPSGYSIDLRVPQAPNVSPALATADLREAKIVFPEGVSVSPSAAAGLVGCPETGPEGIDMPAGGLTPNQAGEGEAIGADGLSHLTPGRCPAASTLGSVEIKTPLLAEPLHGNLYLAQPKCGAEGQPACSQADAVNGNLFGLYLEAEGSGVVIKLKGQAAADPATGRLTATFRENPQLPFSDLKIQLKGGPRAPLANPQACGTFTTVSALMPWSSESPAEPSSSFAIGSGCGGGFSPAFSAGTITPLAGAFSPFTLTFSRHDGEQDLSGVTVTTPPGLLGMLSRVQLCPEPQASNGTCGAQSLIGHTTVGAGPGSQPFYVPGNVFLTGPYKGQPFGLSIVTHALAGPFDLGNVIVRAAIHVDPHTSALTVVGDPLPQIIDGVPLRIQTVNVTVDRPGFIFNPTNCSQQYVNGTITGAQGASASVSSPFAVAGCATLPFKPSFAVSTQGKTSKANGASLVVKVAQNPGEANIHKVSLQLPLALPSRLTTLQKACTASQFESNPAGCPEGSFVGTATAHTPLLAVPLTGPAILVSHGGAAFPDVVFVLQGEGIRIDLVGNTDIKKGITFSRFETVPDAPISSFETSLPEGPHSVLGANGSLCATKTVTVKKPVTQRVHGRTVHVLKNVKQVVPVPLLMPTTITGQNGAMVAQSTKIAVTGCPKAKKAKKAKRASKARHHNRKGRK